jgi:hypothetical protein
VTGVTDTFFLKRKREKEEGVGVRRKHVRRVAVTAVISKEKLGRTCT